MEREQARAAAEEAAAAELTFVRLCEFCGRSKFKNIMSYSQHKRYCFDVLCKGLASSAAGESPAPINMRSGGKAPARTTSFTPAAPGWPVSARSAAAARPARRCFRKVSVCS